MKNGDFADEDIRKLINYGLTENNINANNISSWKIDSILIRYYNYCADFKENYVIGELDTFKKAACLLVAISEKKLVKDRRLNAHIAIDAAEKMCEKPYWNVGPGYDTPCKMEEVNYKDLLEYDPDFYNTHRNNLTVVLACGAKISPISIFADLDSFYRTALILEKNRMQENHATSNNKQKKLEHH